MNSNNTVFPRDIVCLRNISINTLHEGDDDDSNNNKEMRIRTWAHFGYIIPMN